MRWKHEKENGTISDLVNVHAGNGDRSCDRICGWKSDGEPE